MGSAVDERPRYNPCRHRPTLKQLKRNDFARGSGCDCKFDHEIRRTVANPKQIKHLLSLGKAAHARGRVSKSLNLSQGTQLAIGIGRGPFLS
jgi:hypothetical protein